MQTLITTHYEPADLQQALGIKIQVYSNLTFYWMTETKGQAITINYCEELKVSVGRVLVSATAITTVLLRHARHNPNLLAFNVALKHT